MSTDIRHLNDITVIIPLHKTDGIYFDMLKKAIENIESMEYAGKTSIMVVLGNDTECPDIKSQLPLRFVVNEGPSDYCSQVNCGVSQVTTEYFTIMEVDDHYNTKWFDMVNEYMATNGDVSMFIPINVVHDVKSNMREFVNHIAWSTGFTSNDENIDVADNGNIGFVTFNSLQDTASFNLTGGVFKTCDWLGYKPSIKVAFNYEYMLRATSKKQRIMVVPKEGYYHDLFRQDSLSQQYVETITDKETVKWFELAKREYAYDEDRNNDIIGEKLEVLK